jgi:hypothetical protein
MPIEFSCPACQTLIRTPDGTAGMPARCPKCGAVVIVPGSLPGSAAAAAGGFPKPQIGVGSPFAPLPGSFQQAEVQPPAAESNTPLNPYAPPANPFAHDPFQPLPAAHLAERARSQLLWPAIGMLVFSVLGLGFMAIIAVVAAADPNILFRQVGPDPAERAGAIGFFIGYFGLGFVTRALQILGAIAMLRRRGYGLALAGAISAVIPCEIYCCLPSLAFGIWALIMLNSATVKAAFGRG